MSGRQSAGIVIVLSYRFLKRERRRHALPPVVIDMRIPHNPSVHLPASAAATCNFLVVERPMFPTSLSFSAMVGPHFPLPDPAEFVLMKQRDRFDSLLEPHLTWCVQCLSFGAPILDLATLRCSGEVLASGYGTLTFEKPGVVRYRDNTVSRTDVDTVSAKKYIFLSRSPREGKSCSPVG